MRTGGGAARAVAPRRASALRALKVQLGDASWDTVAEAVGIRRSRLFQLLGTEKLPEAIQADIRAGRLTEKQSRALQGLPGEQQRALRDAILADDLSADTALAIARRLKADRVPDELDAAAAAISRIRAELAVATGAADLADRLLAALDRHLAGEPLPDDLTLVALARETDEVTSVR